MGFPVYLVHFIQLHDIKDALLFNLDCRIYNFFAAKSIIEALQLNTSSSMFVDIELQVIVVASFALVLYQTHYDIL